MLIGLASGKPKVQTHSGCSLALQPLYSYPPNHPTSLWLIDIQSNVKVRAHRVVNDQIAMMLIKS